MRKRVGIITFHHSYNCGSMLQAYALQTIVQQLGSNAKIINFSNEGQQRIYSVLPHADSYKNALKKAILLPRKGRIRRNFDAYERFISTWFSIDGPVVSDPSLLVDDDFDVVISGSDQVWNVTIEDGDDAYFLPWVTRARKVAYAPSFGAKDPSKFACDPQRYAAYLERYDYLSVRENNGRKWIKALVGIDVPVLLDPTLLLGIKDYSALESAVYGLPERYLFYYAPSYSPDINRLVDAVSKKYSLPVIAFNSKTFYTKGMNFTSRFILPELESPATYLTLIKNATVVFTTSFHGTIFSTIYRKPFWTIKNGGMFGDDDRVLTLAATLGIEDRLCMPSFDENLNYLSSPDWTVYTKRLTRERQHSIAWLSDALK